MSSNRGHLLAFLALSLASSIWGVNNSVMKITLLTIPVFSLAFIRFGAASVILLPFVIKKLKVSRRDLFKIILASLFAVTANISFFFWGIKLTTALNAGIIITSTPIFTLFCARVFLKEKITARLVFGAILGLIGILTIIGKDIIEHGLSFSPLGDLLVLLATISFVGYEMLSKKLSKNYSSFTITYYLFAIGAATFLPLAIIDFLQNPSWIKNLQASSLIGVGYGIFLSSFAAYSLWSWGLSKIEASRVGFFFYLDPIVSTVAAVILLSEVITVPFILGASLIFLGIFIAEGRLPYHHAHAHVQKMHR